jgi:hypothetical protein
MDTNNTQKYLLTHTAFPEVPGYIASCLTLLLITHHTTENYLNTPDVDQTTGIVFWLLPVTSCIIVEQQNLPIPKLYLFTGPLVYRLPCTIYQEKLNPGYRSTDPKGRFNTSTNHTEVLSYVSIFL